MGGRNLWRDHGAWRLATVTGTIDGLALSADASGSLHQSTNGSVSMFRY